MSDQYEPWYMQVAKEPNAKKREELIVGTFGMDKYSSKSSGFGSSGISSLLVSSAILYGLGGLFFGHKAQKSQKNHANHSYLISPNNQEPEDLNEILPIVVKYLEDSLKQDKDLTHVIERKFETEKFKHLIDVVPRDYNVKLKKAIAFVNSYIFQVEQFISIIKNKNIEIDIDFIQSQLLLLGNLWEERSRLISEASDVINNWVNNHENTEDGKIAKKLLNDLNL